VRANGPCGSGKKYKLCCLSADGGTPPTSAAGVSRVRFRWDGQNALDVEVGDFTKAPLT
jgi:uncharacterized protein YchJ